MTVLFFDNALLPHGWARDVRLTLEDGRKLWNVVKTGSSYCSQSELPLTFGLGKSSKVTAIQITWPNGRSETARDIPSNRSVTLEEGKGIVRNVPIGSR